MNLHNLLLALTLAGGPDGAAIVARFRECGAFAREHHLTVEVEAKAKELAVVRLLTNLQGKA